MTPTASPNNERSTHHVVLSSGSTNVGLVLCDSKGNANPLNFDREPIESGTIKIFQGLEKYSDLDLPYETVVQQEWGGGRGSKDFDKDSSMYYDSVGMNAMRGNRIILGGLPVYIILSHNDTHRQQNGFWPHHIGGDPYTYGSEDITSDNWIAMPFAPVADYTPKHFYFVQMRNSSLSSSAYQVEIRESSGGLPGSTILYSGSVSAPTNVFQWEIKRIDLSEIVAGGLKAGTQYFVVIHQGALMSRASVLKTTTGATIYFSSNQGTNWSTKSGGFFYRVVDDEIASFEGGSSYKKAMRGHFAEYKGALYMAAEYSDGTPSKLYFNGAHNPLGVATGTQSETALQDTTKNWATNVHVGAIVRIMRGTGSDQPRPWRIITSNTANTLAVNEPWDIVPVSGSSEYAIVGHHWFSEITNFDTNYDVQVKDILAANGALYFANGDGTAMIRMVEYNNAGTWTRDWSDLGSYTAGSAAETGQFTYLLYAGDEAGNFVWGAKAGFPPQLYKAKAVDCTGGVPGSPSLSFEAFDGSNGNVGDLYERITGLIQYGEFGNVHVLKEGSVHRIYNGRPFRISTEEQRVSSDYRTGKAKTTSDSYLYFSWHDNVIRYYEGVFDNIGPNKIGTALPTNRRGEISAIATYPGMIIIAIDAGTSGYSSVMAYNGQGWHDLFVAPEVGLRILSLYVQSMPGNCVDRLWFTCGIDIMWLPLSIDPVNHPFVQYHFYPFIWGGKLTSGYHYLGMNDVPKHYKELKFNIDTSYTATLYYTLQDRLDEIFQDTSSAIALNSSTETYESAISWDGNRMAVGVILHASYSNSSPIINVIALSAVKRFSQENRTIIQARLQDHDVDLLGQPDDYVTALAKYNALIALQNTTGPVTMSSMISSLDGLSVFVDRVKPRPVWETFNERDRGNVERYLVEIVLIDA